MVEARNDNPAVINGSGEGNKPFAICSGESSSYHQPTGNSIFIVLEKSLQHLIQYRDKYMHLL